MKRQWGHKGLTVGDGDSKVKSKRYKVKRCKAVKLGEKEANDRERKKLRNKCLALFLNRLSVSSPAQLNSTAFVWFPMTQFEAANLSPPTNTA